MPEIFLNGLVHSCLVSLPADRSNQPQTLEKEENEHSYPEQGEEDGDGGMGVARPRDFGSAFHSILVSSTLCA